MVQIPRNPQGAFVVRAIVGEKVVECKAHHIVRARVLAKRLFRALCEDFAAWENVEVYVLEPRRSALDIIEVYQNESARQSHDVKRRRGYHRW